MSTIMYNGRPYTKCGFNNLYVNNYGIGCVKYVDKKMGFSVIRVQQFVKWHKRKSDGKKYILVERESHDLDKLIARFCGDHNGFNGRDGHARDIRYLDGDLNHCYQDNLEWVLRPHTIDPKTGMRMIELNLPDATVTVYENGDVCRDGQKKSPGYIFIDSDTNLWYTCDPYYNFVWQGRREDADNLMNLANFISGDEASMQNPVILHRDNDWLNFAADNLEWVEADDPRYQDYIKKKAQDMQALADSYNNKP